MPRRTAVPKSIETELLTACHRRCCLCFFLDSYFAVKKGQIAHLNKQRDDNRLSNLVWLCLDHHDTFDSVTSQSKNYTEQEVRKWRDRLHAHFLGKSNPEPSTPNVAEGDAATASQRPWRNFIWGVSDPPHLFAYLSRNRIDGVCVIECVPLEDGRTVVACIAVPGNPGNSITNTVETICEQICQQYEIEPGDLVWLENYDYIDPTEWNRVTFDSMLPDRWGAPKWAVMDRTMWADLGLRPVARLRSRHGGLISKLRYA